MRLDELTALLGSRSRALSTLAFVYAGRLPPELPASMPGVSRRALQILTSRCELPRPEVVERSRSADGTTKYALSFDGAVVETVLIPARGRSTVCVSSQAGCTRRCTFCATARLGFGRNLTASEIVTQYLVARVDAADEAPARNVVFMGMGEPMDNLDAVLCAIDILTQPPAPRLSLSHLTVSTSGVLPGTRRFLSESRANLALSLNGTTDAMRERLMPQNRTAPLSELLALLREDRRTNPRRQHFIEYVLFAGVNDTDEDAARLVALLDGVAARVNLIPHNPFEGSPFAPPHRERAVAFQAIVHRARIRCLVRWPRGCEIGAACGQLARGPVNPGEGLYATASAAEREESTISTTCSKLDRRTVGGR
jgi:23S rRNA (adenine2503-C2)-methyltransferase